MPGASRQSRGNHQQTNILAAAVYNTLMHSAVNSAAYGVTVIMFKCLTRDLGFAKLNVGMAVGIQPN